MPDGTRGFSMGRGKGLAEAARAAISRLKLTAAPFELPTPARPAGGGSPMPAADMTLSQEATEDAEV